MRDQVHVFDNWTAAPHLIGRQSSVTITKVDTMCAVGCSQEPKKTPQLFLDFFSRLFPTQTQSLTLCASTKGSS